MFQPLFLKASGSESMDLKQGIILMSFVKMKKLLLKSNKKPDYLVVDFGFQFGFSGKYWL